jgi:hypothetical protein
MPINKQKFRIYTVFLIIFAIAGMMSISCRRAGSGGVDILGTSDETDEAVKLVASANEELTRIKVLYNANEGKREELKKTMAANDAAATKKIADDIVYLINDGAADGKSAVEKIQKAQELQINDDYREYLRLKEESLKRELEAFENYRLAALMLRDSFDPKNSAAREKVKEEFKLRSDNYRKIMEGARDYSNRANELAKEVMRRQQQQQ